jgi:hypothetical protein
MVAIQFPKLAVENVEMLHQQSVELRCMGCGRKRAHFIAEVVVDEIDILFHIHGVKGFQQVRTPERAGINGALGRGIQDVEDTSYDCAGILLLHTTWYETVLCVIRDGSLT